MGREKVEERETGVMTEEIEASMEEVDARSRKLSLSVKALMKEKQKANVDHTKQPHRKATTNIIYHLSTITYYQPNLPSLCTYAFSHKTTRPIQIIWHDTYFVSK